MELNLVIILIAMLLALAFSFFIVIRRRKKRRASEEDSESKGEEILKTNLDILPVRMYDETLEAFVLEDGSYFDFFEIVAKDRENLQDDVVRYDIYTLARFEKLYAMPHKDYGLNFPIDTSLQRANLNRKLKMTADPVRKEWLMREIDELATLDSNIDRKEFYRCYFAKTREEFMKNKTNILNWIGYGRNKIVREIGKEKKIQIVRKLCNMNALVLEGISEGSDEYEFEE